MSLPSEDSDPRDQVLSRLRPGAAPHDAETLRAFLVYRILLSSLLAFFAVTSAGPALLGWALPTVFQTTALVYLAASIAQGMLSYTPVAAARTQALATVLTDILLLTLIMFTSGGVESGLGMLLAVSIAAGGGLSPGRTALFLAAIATLVVMVAQGLAHLYQIFPTTAYTHAGVLGAAYFAIAALARVLGERLRRTEQIASRREVDLANLAELNEYIIQQMETGVLALDADQRIRLINGAAWHLLGMPDSCRDQPLAVVAPGLAHQVSRWRAHDERHQRRFRVLPQGKDLGASFAPLGGPESKALLVFLEDTARLNEQAQRLKLGSLGRLAASIAHEIRNPLGAIGHAGQLLDESEAIPPGDHRLIEIITTNTRRVNLIIDNVLQLSRRDHARPRETLLRELLEEVAADISQRRELPRECVHVDVQPPGAQILVDPSQLRQVLVNLCENAVDHFQLPVEELRLQLVGGTVREAGGPVLDICDNGPGIPPESARQIFEPFFTTRSSGSGLGLYIARELSEANGVRLEYIPKPLGGTCFRMLLPVRPVHARSVP